MPKPVPERPWLAATMGVVVEPFDGMVSASDPGEVEWALTRMRGRDDVGLIVPDAFEAVLRVMLPADDGIRWADVAPQFLERGRALTEDDLSDSLYVSRGGDDLIDALVPVLAAATTTPQRCHYGAWVGAGGWEPGSTAIAVATLDGSTDPAELERTRRDAEHGFDARNRPMWNFVASCPVVPWWGGRDMFMVDGPIDAAVTIGTPGFDDDPIHRESPNWWWPHDRSWFVGLEIDDWWSYVAGPRELIDTVAAVDGVETVEVTFTDAW